MRCSPYPYPKPAADTDDIVPARENGQRKQRPSLRKTAKRHFPSFIFFVNKFHLYTRISSPPRTVQSISHSPASRRVFVLISRRTRGIRVFKWLHTTWYSRRRRICTSFYFLGRGGDKTAFCTFNRSYIGVLVVVLSFISSRYFTATTRRRCKQFAMSRRPTSYPTPEYLMRFGRGPIFLYHAS